MGNSDSGRSDQQRLGIVSVRIMVHKWPMASSSNLQLIVVQEEVTEIDGKQVTHASFDHCVCWSVSKSVGWGDRPSRADCLVDSFQEKKEKKLPSL